MATIITAHIAVTAAKLADMLIPARPTALQRDVITLQETYHLPALEMSVIDAEGIITGIDANSEKQTYGQLTLVRVMNPSGLEGIGEGLYRETVNSGAVSEGRPGSPSFATLISGALEGSNTDAAQEFTQIIIAQRAYQAAARTFGVGDEMLKLATDVTQ